MQAILRASSSRRTKPGSSSGRSGTSPGTTTSSRPIACSTRSRCAQARAAVPGRDHFRRRSRVPRDDRGARSAKASARTATFFLSGASLDRPFSFHFERLQRAYDAGAPDLAAVVTGDAVAAHARVAPRARRGDGGDDAGGAGRSGRAAPRARPGRIRRRGDAPRARARARRRRDDGRVPHVPTRPAHGAHGRAAGRCDGESAAASSRRRRARPSTSSATRTVAPTSASRWPPARRASGSATRRAASPVTPRSNPAPPRPLRAVASLGRGARARARVHPRQARKRAIQSGSGNALLLERGAALDAADAPRGVDEPLRGERAERAGDRSEVAVTRRARDRYVRAACVRRPARRWPRATQRVKSAWSSSTPCSRAASPCFSTR